MYNWILTLHMVFIYGVSWRAMERRQLIHALVAGVGGASVAGCSSRDDDDVNSVTPSVPRAIEGTPNTPARTPSTTLTPTATQTPFTTSLGPTPPYEETTKLAAARGKEWAHFGSSVAMSDDGGTVIIGTPWERNPNNDPDGGTEQAGPAAIKITAQGSATVFSKNLGAWTKVAKLTPTGDEDFTSFGMNVALSGDGSTAIITSSNNRVYVFTDRSGDWAESATLTPGDAESDRRFGSSVAVSTDGSTALVGARSTNPGNPPSGWAYVFQRDGEAWRQETTLTAADADGGDEFGVALALSGDGTTAVVTAESDEDPNGRGAGSAYVFSRSGGSWTQAAKLAAADGDSRDYFGDAVALSGDGSTVIVGTMDADTAHGDRAGAAYVFSQAAGSWRQDAKLIAKDSDAFGSAIAVSDDGSRALITDASDDTPNGASAGSAYLFTNQDGEWGQAAKFIAPDGDRSDRFGWAVAMAADGSQAVISAARDEDPNGKFAGSAYVFE